MDNQPPGQQNNQTALENQVAALAQQVSLLTQLLIQQQTNQQQGVSVNSSGPSGQALNIQSEEITSNSSTQVIKEEPKSPDNETPRQTRKSMDQMSAEERHRRAVASSDESDYEDKNQKYAERLVDSKQFSSFKTPSRGRRPLNPDIRRGPMTKEEFARAFPNEDPDPEYNSKGQEICLTCGTTDIRCKHRCAVCYSRHKLDRYRANPRNYRKCHSFNKENVWHQGEFATECSTCYQWSLKHPGHKRSLPNFSTPHRQRQQVHRNRRINLNTSPQPMTQEEYEMEFFTELDPRFNSRGQEVCVDCNKADVHGVHRCYVCYCRHNERRRRANPRNYYKCRLCKTPNTFHRGENSSSCFKCYKREYNARKAGTSVVKRPPRNKLKFDKNGGQSCVDCGSTQIKANNRCTTCYYQKIGQSRRVDPNNYYKCRECKQFEFHESEVYETCLKCYRYNAGERPSSSQQTRNRPVNLKGSSQQYPTRPLSLKEFQERYTNQQFDAFVTQSGELLCGDCQVNQIEKVNRCIPCYNKFAEERRRHNPDFYCYCGHCDEFFYSKLNMKPKRCQQCNSLFQKSPVSEKETPPLVSIAVTNKADCNKFRAGWTRIRRQMQEADKMREQRKQARQQRRNQSSLSNKSDVIIPAFNVGYWKPKGWSKGQCKACRIVLSKSSGQRISPNFCRECSVNYLNQRVCTVCRETRRHYGKGMCGQVFNDLKPLNKISSSQCYQNYKNENRSLLSNKIQSKNFKVEKVDEFDEFDENFLNQEASSTRQNNNIHNVSEHSRRLKNLSDSFEFGKPEVIDLTMSDDE